MLDKLQAVANRFEELCARSEQPDFYNDPKKAAAILRERNDLEPIIEAYHAYRSAELDMKDAQELMSDPDMKELCQQTYTEAKQAMRVRFSLFSFSRRFISRRFERMIARLSFRVRRFGSLFAIFIFITSSTWGPSRHADRRPQS